MYDIIEVGLGSSTTEPNIELEFKRVRYDKKRANSLDVANAVLAEYLQPTLLSDITFKVANTPFSCLDGEMVLHNVSKTVHKVVFPNFEGFIIR